MTINCADVPMWDPAIQYIVGDLVNPGPAAPGARPGATTVLTVAEPAGTAPLDEALNGWRDFGNCTPAGQTGQLNLSALPTYDPAAVYAVWDLVLYEGAAYVADYTLTGLPDPLNDEGGWNSIARQVGSSGF